MKMGNRKIRTTTLLMLATIAILVGAVIAQIVLDRAMNFSATIKSVPGLSIYLYGTTTPTAGFDYGEFDPTTSQVKDYAISLKNVGNKELTISWVINSTVSPGWALGTPDIFLKKTISAVDTWRFECVYYGGSINFASEGSVSGASGANATYVLGAGKTFSLNCRLLAFQQLTILDSLSFQVNFHASA